MYLPCISQVGEQAMSEAELYSLRLYTGPPFAKYNSVLRGAAAAETAPFMHERFVELCRGNTYAMPSPTNLPPSPTISYVHAALPRQHVRQHAARALGGDPRHDLSLWSPLGPMISLWSPHGHDLPMVSAWP